MIKLYLKKIDDAKSHSENFARNILGKHLNVDSNGLKICKNEFGKPYLVDYQNIHYNISHTKGAITCVVSDQPVGVDIERVKIFNKRIGERFFTQNEQNYIFAFKEKQDEKFARIWTMKEAYVKWIGKGMTIPFESFDVLNGTNIYSIRIDNFYISICSSQIKIKEQNLQLNIKVEILNSGIGENNKR